MICDSLKSLLESSALTSRTICEKLELPVTPENVSVIDIISLLNTDIYNEEGKWTLSAKRKSTKILALLENYARSSGKKIFRISSALGTLAIDDQPTEEELRRLIESTSGRFELLANQMIRYNR